MLVAQVTIDPPSRSFTKDGGAGAILTQGSGSWTASTPDSWINITPRTSGVVGDSCIYVVSSNFSADTRIGQISINGNIHTVSQFGYPATLAPSSATVDLDGDTGSVSISVAAGVSWTATSNSDWIEVSPASGLSSGSVSYTVDPNPGVTTRNGSLTIAGQTFTVTQTGTDVNLSPKSVEKAYSSDIIQLQVTALVGTNWTVTPNAPWISVVDDGNGFGDSQITLAVGTNPSFLERTGTVSIGSATFTVVQAGTPNPVLDIVPDEATADPIGAFGNAAILATPDAPWTAESEEPWIIIANGTTGAGNGNIEYVVSANPDLAERSGRIRVAPPVYKPDVDLTWLLYSHVYQNNSDLTGWGRGLDAAIATPFDGTNPRSMYGQSFYRDSDDFSVAFWFTINEGNAVNRLFEAQTSATTYTTLYVDASNRLILSSGGETLSSELVVTPGTEYQLVLSVDEAHLAKLYCAPRSDAIAQVGEQSFSSALFPHGYVEPDQITLGSSQQPAPGNLDNATLDDLRLYGRAINDKEVAALAQYAGTATPYGDTSHGGDPATTLEYNFRGQALATGGSRAALVESLLRSNSVFTYYDLRSVTSRNSRIIETYTGDFSQSSIFETIGSSGSWDSGSSNTTIWFYRFHYEDGSYADTQGWSVSYPSPNVSYYFFSPQDKPIVKIDLYGWKSSSLSIVNGNVRTGVADLLPIVSSSDRYNFIKSSIKGEGASGRSISIYDHSKVFSSSDATYNFWLRFDAFEVGLPIFERSASGGANRLGLNFAVGAAVEMSYNGVSRYFQAGFEPGDWFMLTVSGDYGGSTRIYVNGGEIGNSPDFNNYQFGLNSSLPDMFIGIGNGAIDYAGFYDGALSSAEVKAIYDAQKFDYQYHTVTQGAVSPSVTPTTSSFAASGGSGSADLTIAGNVNWSASSDSGWISLTSATSGIGSTTTTFDVAANTSVYERQGTITLAGESVTITQAGLGANLDYSELIFGTDGGSDWIDVSPEANGSWEAVSNDSWLTIAIGSSGTGPGSVLVVADPYSQTSQSRTGTIEVAGQTIYVTQRGYQLSVSPQIAQVGSNSGAGEFGVAAPISAVWEAITTQDWISINGSSTGVGNGTLRYTVATNNTGATRTGRIIVSGTEYTITQVSSLQVNATAGTGGSVNGSGGYETNATATLTAIPATGYAFSHWTGDAVGSANPLELTVDSDKDVQAHFIPDTAATSFVTAGQNAVLADPNAFNLYNENQLRTMAIGSPVLSVDRATNTLTVGFGLRQTDDLSNWSNVNVQASQTFIRNGNIEVDITVDADAKFYQIITE
jgi:hypothetical protein